MPSEGFLSFMSFEPLGGLAKSPHVPSSQHFSFCLSKVGLVSYTSQEVASVTGVVALSTGLLCAVYCMRKKLRRSLILKAVHEFLQVANEDFRVNCNWKARKPSPMLHGRSLSWLPEAH